MQRNQYVKKEKVGQTSQKDKLGQTSRKKRRGEMSSAVEYSFQIHNENAQDPYKSLKQEEFQNAQVVDINEDFDKRVVDFKGMLEDDMPKLDISELLNFEIETLKKVEDTTKDVVENKSERVIGKSPNIIGKHIFYLNKSRCKWIEVGLCIPNLDPVIFMGGQKTNGLLLSLEEWSALISKKEELLKNLATSSTFCISFLDKIVQTESINNNRIVKICALKNNVVFEHIYLAPLTINELFKYEATVTLLIQFFKQLNFKYYFETISNSGIVANEEVNYYQLLMSELSAIE